MLKRDVRESEGLQVYLQEQAEKSTRLYHYTTLESLLCIIKNQTFRLTRMDLMNDKAEKTLGVRKDGTASYVMSFTRDKEYVSMWAIYGKPSGIKIRLDFDRLKFQSIINNNFYSDSEKLNKLLLVSSLYKSVFSKHDWLISDIVYIDKDKKQFRHNEDSFPNIIAEQPAIEDLAGFVKYDAWEFERETRLRVRVGSGYENTAIDQYLTHIYAGLDNELIKTFHVTFNPWLTDEMKKVVRESLRSVAGFEVPCSNSINDGEIGEL